jgi:hypothetical protein
MNLNSRWISPTVVAIVATLTFTGLEPAAFAASPDGPPQSEERVTTSAPSVALPSRPALMTNAVAQAIPPGQTARTTTSTARPAYTPPAKQSQGSSKKKWIFIILGAAAAATTVAILASGDGSDEGPTVQIGAPVVGQPQ